MSKRDYYEVLGIARSATKEEIKASYRKLALQYHPDRNPGNTEAEDKFKEATEAYEVLADEQKKERYDRFGHQGMRSGQDFHQYQNVNDIFSMFGDLFGGGAGGGGGIFEQMFGFSGGGGGRQGGQRRSMGEPGSDLKVRMPMTLEEIATGVEKTLSLKHWIQCDTCDGSGAKPESGYASCPLCNGSGEIRQVSRSVFGQFINVAVCSNCSGSGQVVKEPCLTCKGDGRVRGESSIKITVPAGVTTGNYIPVRGKGNAGKRGGEAGDVIIVIEETEHDYFVREQDDVIYDLTISYPDAALGGEVDVPTLDGSATLTIEPGTQPGTMLRMRDKGIPHLNAYGRGDQIVRINVYVPTKLAAKEKEALRELGKSSNISPGASAEKEGKKGKDFFDKVREVFS